MDEAQVPVVGAGCPTLCQQRTCVISVQHSHRTRHNQAAACDQLPEKTAHSTALQQHVSCYTCSTKNNVINIRRGKPNANKVTSNAMNFTEAGEGLYFCRINILKKLNYTLVRTETLPVPSA